VDLLNRLLKTQFRVLLFVSFLFNPSLLILCSLVHDTVEVLNVLLHVVGMCFDAFLFSGIEVNRCFCSGGRTRVDIRRGMIFFVEREETCGVGRGMSMARGIIWRGKAVGKNVSQVLTDTDPLRRTTTITKCSFFDQDYSNMAYLEVDPLVAPVDDMFEAIIKTAYVLEDVEIYNT